jgi:rare lipoprotein A (peptidoglycan hydrolase)
MHICIRVLGGLSKLYLIIALTGIMTVGGFGAETAWAAEASVSPTLVPQQFRFLRLSTAQAQEEMLDPYLAKAMKNLPDYGYTAAGSVIGDTHPITSKGSWQKAQPKKPVVPVVIYPTKPVGESVLVLEGEASYYSRAGCLGCSPALTMANGQPLDDNALTMAIGANLKHLVGHKARVTSLATGKSTTVLITDTGGFYQAKYGNRVADLTIATKQAIGMAGGVGQVRVEVF